MKVVYTDQSIKSLEEALDFMIEKLQIPRNVVNAIKNQVFSAAEDLAINPHLGQKELLLGELDLGHRRLISGHFKIIYRIVKETIYITDFFDSRQDPDKMKA